MSEDRRYIVGERVLASRAENGKDHEEATVVDYYTLLVEGDSIPSIVVDFDDGERAYLTARDDNVLPLPEEDDEWDDDESDEGEDEDPEDGPAVEHDGAEEADG